MLHADDLPGSRDPAGLKRYEGTRTTFFEEKAFAKYTLPLGKLALKGGGEINFSNSLMVEGKVTQVTYAGSDPNRSALEVYRNYQAELTGKGWQVLWEGTGKELSDGDGRLFVNLYKDRPGGTFQLSAAGGRFMAAKKGGDHLALFVTNYKAGTVSPKSLQPTPGVPVIALDVIEAKLMEEKMVVVKAEEMNSQIVEQGGVNLYGFYFDTGSATLKPESGPTIDEVEILLKADDSLRLLVVGHTDGMGGFEDNIDLSKRRAVAVVKILAERVPAISSRLTACGVGFQCPVASNATEDGRAKNRRVALVKVEK